MSEKTAPDDFETRVFLVRASVFPIVLTVAIALVNGIGRAIGIGDNPAFIFAVVCPFAVFWFWLTEVRTSGGGDQVKESPDA